MTVRLGVLLLEECAHLAGHTLERAFDRPLDRLPGVRLRGLGGFLRRVVERDARRRDDLRRTTARHLHAALRLQVVADDVADLPAELGLVGDLEVRRSSDSRTVCSKNS